MSENSEKHTHTMAFPSGFSDDEPVDGIFHLSDHSQIKNHFKIKRYGELSAINRDLMVIQWIVISMTKPAVATSPHPFFAPVSLPAAPAYNHVPWVKWSWDQWEQRNMCPGDSFMYTRGIAASMV